MLPYFIRRSFVKTWTQRLTSSFSRHSVPQRFRLTQERLQYPQARWIHEKPGPDACQDEDQPSSTPEDEDNTTDDKDNDATFLFMSLFVILNGHRHLRCSRDERNKTEQSWQDS